MYLKALAWLCRSRIRHEVLLQIPSKRINAFVIGLKVFFSPRKNNFAILTGSKANSYHTTAVQYNKNNQLFGIAIKSRNSTVYPLNCSFVHENFGLMCSDRHFGEMVKPLIVGIFYL